MFFAGIELAMLRREAIKCRSPKVKADLWREVRELEIEIRELEAAVRHYVGEIKAPAVLGYLLTLTEKTLVICHHLDILGQLEQALKRAGRGVVVHSGQHDSPTEAVKAFQDPNSGVQFFIGQAMAASLSLTLTAAHHVVFAELPPTRADFDQAVDRIHRIGQERDDVLITVFTIDLFASGDSALLHHMRRKKAVADQILDLKPEEEAAAAGVMDFTGGGWDWRARWVWWHNQIAPHDETYEDEAAEWSVEWFEAMVGDIFTRMFGHGSSNTGERRFKPKLSPRTKIKLVIMALRRKTVKRGASPGEAAMAQRKAKELMTRYNIKEEEMLRVVAQAKDK
jgi:hypothetical protein